MYLDPEKTSVRLTETTKAGGCAAKLSPAILDNVLSKLKQPANPNVLVGFDKADDAGVYKISDELAVVQTVDFFTPMVDDPYTFGQVAATNALSDVYAMGGRVISALALVCFPEKEDVAILERIMAGGLSKMIEAGCAVVGGHSIKDAEIKFGYAVTGLIDPRRVLKNSSARVGDALVFTKALGTGVISTAVKRKIADSVWVEAAERSMTTLNKRASEICLTRDVHAMTDVTGFGMIGHAREMALGSDVGLKIFASATPLLAGARACVEAECIPGGLRNNRAFAESCVSVAPDVPEQVLSLLYDPQTAGGLLVSVGAADADALVADLRAEGIAAARIGEVTPRTHPILTIAA
ncbi:selenide,water dikinase [Rhodoblastus acidophilus]|uniref:selenide, water dikinase SelD n=1 Tax=Rhodoblastus acidophilus TaxID=1074 RepID=UPI00222493EB|nr:selenide, water dikinase SelD [Rhodoblastus acidophilus]MCW2285416.1 selenide,water dikinase [Rhodoblastus acidophilus]MCW2334335.1 selenide,water dikinase [Rhodoblastus acidophilus]